MTSALLHLRSIANREVVPSMRRYFSRYCGSYETFLKGESTAPKVSQVSHNASPRLPLLYYKATNHAMASMNHRVFYANWIFVFAAYDILTSYVDF